MRVAAIALCVLTEVLGRGAFAQPAFAVATIRPSAKSVQFESDGRTDISPGHIRMHDVTVATCLKWAYGLQASQVVGPETVTRDRFDIEAKADDPVGIDELKSMMQGLLAERFGLKFHRENRELKGYSLVVAKGGSKVTPAAPGEPTSRINSATGTVVKAMTIQEFADFIAGPLQTPVVDKTGLPGRYDFTLDFTSYLPAGERAMRPDMTELIFAAVQGELGLKFEAGKTMVDVLVVDHLEKPSVDQAASPNSKYK